MLLKDSPSNPKVSVIIPAYNTEKYIALALQSALDQTERNIEVIVVDDGSTDGTLAVVESFVDERIKLIVAGNNNGPSHARNRAINEARGEWIAILDSDDWYATERLARLLEMAYLHNVDLIADDLYMIHDNADQPWGTLFSQKGSYLITEPRVIDAVTFVESNLPGENHLGLGSVKPLIRRNFLVQHSIVYDETLRCGEDYGLYLMCLLQGARFTIIPEAYYFYRSREDSIIAENILDNQNCLRQLNVNLLEHKFISSDPNLSMVLSQQLSHIEERINYYRIVDLLKSRSFFPAFQEMVKSPTAFSLFVARIPEMLRFRFRRSMRKIKTILRVPEKTSLKSSNISIPISPAHRVKREGPMKPETEDLD